MEVLESVGPPELEEVEPGIVPVARDGLKRLHLGGAQLGHHSGGQGEGPRKARGGRAGAQPAACPHLLLWVGVPCRPSGLSRKGSKPGPFYASGPPPHRPRTAVPAGRGEPGVVCPDTSPAAAASSHLPLLSQEKGGGSEAKKHVEGEHVPFNMSPSTRLHRHVEGEELTRAKRISEESQKNCRRSAEELQGLNSKARINAKEFPHFFPRKRALNLSWWLPSSTKLHGLPCCSLPSICLGSRRNLLIL